MFWQTLLSHWQNLCNFYDIIATVSRKTSGTMYAVYSGQKDCTLWSVELVDFLFFNFKSVLYTYYLYIPLKKLLNFRTPTSPETNQGCAMQS